MSVLSYRKTDVIRKGQFSLNSLPMRKVKEFASALFDLDIKGKHIWFEKYDPDPRIYRRSDSFKVDEGMNIDRFLTLLTSESYIRLYIGSPDDNVIRFFLQDKAKGSGSGFAHLAWLECDLNIDNYKKLDAVFKKAFGFKLKEVC